MDHFTKYIWFYPLTRKSYVSSTFVNFKQLVENYFSTKIKTLFSDNGGEYLGLRPFLASHGIIHLTTPPHTLDHNGYSERRHCHINETNLTLLHQASIPLTFWPFVFAIAVYLINQMPKRNLSFSSSFEKLFHKILDSTKLRMLGCLCYPWLRVYSSHKLDPKSSLIFLGYSLTQSVFFCFDLTLRKNFVSHHAQFVEHIFPYSSSKSSISSCSNNVSITTFSVPTSPCHHVTFHHYLMLHQMFDRTSPCANRFLIRSLMT